jgi:energy-coupling factor transporter ATP-binding protein EcfA2
MSYDLSIKAVKNNRKDKVPQPKLCQAGILPPLFTSSLLCGPSGSGKSTLLVKLIELYGGKETFNGGIYLFSPTAEGDDVQKELNIPEQHLFTEDLNKTAPEALKVIFESQRDKIKKLGADKAPRVCVIFDDAIQLRDLLKSEEFLGCFTKSRHYGIQVFFCTQSFTKAPRAVRLNCTGSTFVFSPSMSEVDLLCDEFCSQGLNKKEFAQVVQFATDEQYSFLNIFMKGAIKDRFRKGLDQIIRFNKSSRQ